MISCDICRECANSGPACNGRAPPGPSRRTGRYLFLGFVAALHNPLDHVFFAPAPLYPVEIGVPEQYPPDGGNTLDGSVRHPVLVFGDLIKGLKRQQKALLVSEGLFDLEGHCRRQVTATRNDGIESLRWHSDSAGKGFLADLAIT